MMNTLEALRARRKELLAWKKHELERQGGGHGLTFYIINEELLDVSAHLKALVGSGPRRGGKISTDMALFPGVNLQDSQQYRNWRREEESLDDEIDKGRAQLKAAMVRGLSRITPRQREMLELYFSGKKIPKIATALGLNRSTVSRTIARAKENLRNETERAVTAERLWGASARVDLRDPTAMNTLLLAMTTKQAVYFYLYYSEGLTCYQIGELTDTNRSTVSRTIRRGLQNIGTLFGGQSMVLEHPEALDAPAYRLYRELENHPELLPEDGMTAPPLASRAGKPKQAVLAERNVSPQICPRDPGEPPGKLLSALLACREERGSISQRLDTVFEVWRRYLLQLRKKGTRLRGGYCDVPRASCIDSWGPEGER